METQAILWPIALISATLLIASGIAKIRQPQPARLVLVALGIPAGRWRVRLLGLGEVVLGGIALARPSSLAVGGMALVYASFAVAIGVLIVKHIPIESCGCAGAREIRPSWWHASLDALAAVGLTLQVGGAPPSLMQFAFGEVLARWEAVVLLTGIAAASYAAFMIVAELPEAWRAYGGQSPLMVSQVLHEHEPHAHRAPLRPEALAFLAKLSTGREEGDA